MFEKPNATKMEEAEIPEKTTKSRYLKILEDVYQDGGSLSLPELEVFGVDEVDMEAISEFSLSLIEFIEKKEQEADEEELERLYHFGQNIHSEFFSASPSLINYIRLPDRLKLMSRATRSKVIQGTFGSVFVGETVYDVSFMKDRLDEITIKAMEDLSVPEKLDLLHQLRTVGAQAIADGEWSRPAYNQVCQTYESLMNSEDSQVFVQLAAEAGLETLDTEYENPQLSIVRFEGQTSNSRLNTRFSNKQIEALTNKFFSKHSLDRVVLNSTKILPATKDALVCMDKSGLATGIIKLDVEKFLSSPESESGFDVNQYRIYKQHLETSLDFGAQRRDQITVKIYHAIYDEYVDGLITTGDAEGAAKVFAEMLPVLSFEEWRTYFIGEIRQREFPSQNTLYQEAGDENSKVSQEYITELFKYRERLGELYEEDYLELGAALEHNDFDYAFGIASNITLRCRYEKNPTATHQEVAALQDTVRDAHQANFVRAKKKYEALMLELNQTEEIRAKIKAVQKLEQNLDELGSELHTFVENKLSVIGDLPELHFTTLKELIFEIKGDDSLNRVTDEDVLLFQHVHSGELAGKIEAKFGFALSDLSLKEQYFFLNYLKRVTPHSVEPMEHFTSLYGIDGIRTFLSLERGDESLGDKIVAFGTHQEEADRIFAYYSTILDSSEHAETLLTKSLANSILTNEEKQAHLNAVRKKIQSKANKVLEQAIEKGDVATVMHNIQNSSLETAGIGVAYAELLQIGFIKNIADMERIQSIRYTGEAVLENSTLLYAIEKLYRENYPSDTADAHIVTLHKKLSEPRSEVYLLQIDDKILSSILTLL